MFTAVYANEFWTAIVYSWHATAFDMPICTANVEPISNSSQANGKFGATSSSF